MQDVDERKGVAVVVADHAFDDPGIALATDGAQLEPQHRRRVLAPPRDEVVLASELLARLGKLDQRVVVVDLERDDFVPGAGV